MWSVTLLRICLLRADPQNLPTSALLTALTLAAYCATDVAVALETVPLTSALAAAAADTLLIGALTYTALSLCRLGARWQQTLTALAGSGALLAIMTVTVT